MESYGPKMTQAIVFSSALFDVDETLVATSKIHEKAFIETLNEFKVNVDFDYSNYLGMKTSKVFESLDIPHDEIDRFTSRKQEIAGQLMCDVEEMPGAFEILRLLKSNKKEIFTVSSGSKKNVQTSLRVTGLAAFVSGSIHSEDVSYGKPSPECYQLALKRFNLETSMVIAVEDSKAGCQSASLAGIRVIGISDRESLICTKQFSSLVDWRDSLTNVE